MRLMRYGNSSPPRLLILKSHAEASNFSQVADLIIQSLVIFETPVPKKVARLHLVSDILSNSASPLPNAVRPSLLSTLLSPSALADLPF